GAADHDFYDRPGAVAAADDEAARVRVGGGQEGGAGGGRVANHVGGLDVVQLEVVAGVGDDGLAEAVGLHHADHHQGHLPGLGHVGGDEERLFTFGAAVLREQGPDGLGLPLGHRQDRARTAPEDRAQARV